MIGSAPEEIRANAFAVAFLAPPDGVMAAVRNAPDATQAVADIMNRFGISATAARFHARNVAQLDVVNVRNRGLPQPSEEWIVRENLTIDYFPISVTPISRRGRFAWYVAAAFQHNLISADTAAMWLRSPEPEFRAKSQSILSLFPPAAP